MLLALGFLRELLHKILEEAFQLVWPLGLEVEGGLIREMDDDLDSVVAADDVLQGGQGAWLGSFAEDDHVQVLIGQDDGELPIVFIDYVHVHANDLACEDHDGTLVASADLFEECSRNDIAGLELDGDLLRGKAALEGCEFFFALGQLGLEWLDHSLDGILDHSLLRLGERGLQIHKFNK